MALYEVIRVDDVKPGEFDNALVIASGTAQARKAVAHLLPKGAKVEAARYDTTGKGRTKLVSVYWDKREEQPEPQAETLPFSEADEAW